MRIAGTPLLALLLVLVSCQKPADSTPPAAPAAASRAPVQLEPEVDPDEELEAEAEPTDRVAECGDAETCYERGAAAERDGRPALAIESFSSACGLGLGAACNRLGELYRDGRGVEADEDQAHDWFQQGCALGSTSACDSLGH